MHSVRTVDEAGAPTPPAYVGRSAGFRRALYVERAAGSVHMGTGLCVLEPRGEVRPHLHSFEESFYVLEGSLIGLFGERPFLLGPGHYGLIPTGVAHGWRNAGERPVRFLEMQSPQPRPAGEARDTFFVAGEAPRAAAPPDPSDPAAALLGHFDEATLPTPGGPSQMEGFNPITGVAIKMFVDRSFGATHQSLFLIQYMPGARIDPHDHAFEESYYIVGGEVEATADGRTYRLGPGQAIWTGVGCVHSFANVGDRPVRWLETQAPLPPAREVFRFERDWAPHAAAEPP